MPTVKVIAVINQKGGVGKTTTVVNLGAALAARGHDVCLVDLDAQSQLTLHLDVEVAPGRKTIYDVMTHGAELGEAVVDIREHLAVVPSEVDLAAAEMELVGTVGREQVLADRLAKLDRSFEFVLLDCPPSLGLLTLNALAAADELLIPLQAHFFGLQGLSRLFETVSLVRQRINPSLRVGGVVFCMFERQTRLAGEVVADLADFLSSARDTDAPWAKAKIFQNAIRRNVKLAECPSYGRTIFEYEPRSHGAEDYGALADEFLACFAPEANVPQPQAAPVSAPAEARSESESIEAEPAEIPPADSPPTEAELLDVEPVETTAAETIPTESEQVDVEPVHTEPVGVPPVGAAAPVPAAPTLAAPDPPAVPDQVVAVPCDAGPPAHVVPDGAAAVATPAVDAEPVPAVDGSPPGAADPTYRPVEPEEAPIVQPVPAAGHGPPGGAPKPDDRPSVALAPPSWPDPAPPQPEGSPPS